MTLTQKYVFIGYCVLLCCLCSSGESDSSDTKTVVQTDSTSLLSIADPGSDTSSLQTHYSPCKGSLSSKSQDASMHGPTEEEYPLTPETDAAATFEHSSQEENPTNGKDESLSPQSLVSSYDSNCNAQRGTDSLTSSGYSDGSALEKTDDNEAVMNASAPPGLLSNALNCSLDGRDDSQSLHGSNVIPTSESMDDFEFSRSSTCLSSASSSSSLSNYSSNHSTSTSRSSSLSGSSAVVMRKNSSASKNKSKNSLHRLSFPQMKSSQGGESLLLS